MALILSQRRDPGFQRLLMAANLPLSATVLADSDWDTTDTNCRLMRVRLQSRPQMALAAITLSAPGPVPGKRGK